MTTELDRLRADLTAQAELIRSLKQDNAALTETMDACVAEKIGELDAEGEAFNKECWNALRSLCEEQPGFSWSDFDHEMTADDAAEYLRECLRANSGDHLRADNARLREALGAASGYLMNAKIDLETGAPKRTAIVTIEGGLKMVKAALASTGPTDAAR